jgi:transposase
MRLSQAPEQSEGEEEKIGAVETPFTEAEEQRSNRMTIAKELSSQGWANKRIAEYLDIHPKTVSRYIQSTSPKSNRTHGMHLLDPVKPYLLKRWNEGCHNAALLYREIKTQGFSGEYSTVLIFARQLRKASGLLPKVHSQEGKPVAEEIAQNPPSLRKLTSLIMKRPENRVEDAEKLLELLSSEKPKITTTVALARTFSEIVRQQRAAKLDLWLEQAEKSGYRVWRNFASGIKQDYKAVHSALSLTWSNGPTEGHVNRLKYLKRQMYGRGKEDLLRKRALLQGLWTFT